MSNEKEFILQPDSVFNISCTGKRNVLWAEPLPKNTFVYPGYYTATLFIYNATVENTGYYMCTYEDQDSELEGELEEDREAGIYVFVPGECFLTWCQVMNTSCKGKSEERQVNKATELTGAVF